MIILSDTAIDPPALLGEFAARNAGAGAIVSFLGQVRGEGVEALTLDHHFATAGFVMVPA